jgi:hypothetical protein
MENVQGFEFHRLAFDAEGKPTHLPALDALAARAAAATDAIVIAHGFRNDEQEASRLYEDFLRTLRTHVSGPFQAELGPRRFLVAGVYWPSKAFDEGGADAGSAQGLDDERAAKDEVKETLEELKAEDACAQQRPRIDRAIRLLDSVKDDPGAQDDFVREVLSLLEDAELDPTEGLDRFVSTSGSELLAKLAFPVILPGTAPDGEGGVAASVLPRGDGEGGHTEGLGVVVGSIFGRIGQFLNLTTWYVMKNRSGVVGAGGLAKAVRRIKATSPTLRLHLVGHSLGGRLVAACARSLTAAPAVAVDSLTLLEAAFSHYGFSADNGKGQAGFFRPVVEKRAVRGPLFATFSAQDRVVGKAYALASRLVGDNVQAVGDAGDPYGGIGRNGAQRTAEAVFEPLRRAGGTRYTFPPGKVVNLDGSGGIIKDHSDVTNPHVTFAFACALAQA